MKLSNANNFYLKPHNQKAAQKLQEAYKSGKQIASVIEVTGGGKTFVALDQAQKLYPKKVLFLVPKLGIKEQVEHTIEEYNLQGKVNIEFRTYQSFLDVTKEQVESYPFDMLVVDEFHHMGAPVWGQRVVDLILSHPQSRVLGMSAYHIRNKGKYNAYDVAPTLAELDLTRDDVTEEDLPIFTDSVVFNYNLAEALVDGVLPVPKYVTCTVKLLEYARTLQQKVLQGQASEQEKQKYSSELNSIINKLDKAQNFDDVMKAHLKEGDKCIYFAPSGVNSTSGKPIIDEVVEKLKNIYPNAVIYTTTAKQLDGKENRDAFYNDADLSGKNVANKLRIMVAIQQYDEGAHVPGVNRIVLGGVTKSDIAFGERIGRGLSASGADDVTILDAGGNIDYMVAIQQEFYDMYNQKTQNLSAESVVTQMRTKNEPQVPFMLEPELVDLLEKLEQIDNIFDDWQVKCDAYFAFVKKYNIMPNQRSENKVEASLCNWANTQRKLNKKGLLSKNRYNILKQRGFVFDVLEEKWQQNYEKYKAFVLKNKRQPMQYHMTKEEKQNNPQKAEEYALATWLNVQRRAYNNGKLDEQKLNLLTELGFVLDVHEEQWQQTYEKYKAFVLKNKRQPINYNLSKEEKRNNPQKAEESALANWLKKQRVAYKNGKLDEQKLKLLKHIGFATSVNEEQWQQKYEKYKAFVLKNKRQPMQYHMTKEEKQSKPQKAEESALAEWVKTQRAAYKKGKLDEQKLNLLQLCGFVFDVYEEQWQQNYEKYKAFVLKNKRQPKQYHMTKEEIQNNPQKAEEYVLAIWINTQRTAYKKGKLDDEKYNKLCKLGFKISKKQEEKEQ